LGMTAEAAREAGYTLTSIQYDPAQPSRIVDATVIGMGTSSDYGTIVGEQRLGEASDLAYTGLIAEGEWAGYTEAQKTVALANNEDPTGMITEGEWEGFTYGQKAAALNSQGIDPETGEPYEDEEVEPEDKKYRMNASELTDRGISLADFTVFGGGVPGSVSQVMISVEQWADLTGEYMFPAAPEADPSWMTELFPSGVKTADVPGLPFDVVSGEYQMNAEALAVFGPLQEAADAERLRLEGEPKATLTDMLTNSPWPDNPVAQMRDASGNLLWTGGALGWVQDAVAILKDAKVPGRPAGSTITMGEVLTDEMLWLRAVEQGAATELFLAQVWAAYTERPFRMASHDIGGGAKMGAMVQPDGSYEQYP